MSATGEFRETRIIVGAGADSAGAQFAYTDESAGFAKALPNNIMSVDVEEHFQVSAFANTVSKGDWATIPSRVCRNMDRILALFAEKDVKATFFTLGCVAERFPQLMRDIVAQGHELASHGYEHDRVSALSPRDFLLDVTRTRKILEDISGSAVKGYRAPSFSINDETAWAHDVLQQAGYTYSSSIYPVNHDHYGFPSAPRFPFRLKDGGLLEVPLTTASALGRNWPAAGGGYFRLLPMGYSRWALRRVNRQDRMPAVFYFHPWEIDPDQPRVAGLPLSSQFRHYVNLQHFEGRLATMLDEFSWGRMDRSLDHIASS